MQQIKIWLGVLLGLLSVFRLFAFENTVLLGKALWWMVMVLAGSVLYAIDWKTLIGVAVIGMVAERYAVRLAIGFKPKLLRTGDSVEYIEPTDELNAPFEHAILITPLSNEAVVERGFFSREDAGHYSAFFMVAQNGKTAVIPFEWIVSIDKELPSTPFASSI